MQTKRLIRIGVIAIALGSLSVSAQAPDVLRTLDAQLGRVFNSADYTVPRFGPARWLPGGAAYAIVERSAGRADAWDIVRYEAATGSRSVILDVPPSREELQHAFAAFTLALQPVP